MLLSACASWKTRYAGDENYSCGRKLDPREYCASFEATPELRRDPLARGAEGQCRAFYAVAVRAANVLCGYFEEMDSLTQWKEEADSSFVSEKAKWIHRKYRARAEEVQATLEKAFADTHPEWQDFEVSARARAERDVRCNRLPATGLQLLGLSAKTREDERRSFTYFNGALGALRNALSLASDHPSRELRQEFPQVRDGEPQAFAQNIRGERVGGETLLLVGQARLPASRELERYYARAKEGSGPLAEPRPGRPQNLGRGLASVDEGGCR